MDRILVDDILVILKSVMIMKRGHRYFFKVGLILTLCFVSVFLLAKYCIRTSIIYEERNHLSQSNNRGDDNIGADGFNSGDRANKDILTSLDSISEELEVIQPWTPLQVTESDSVVTVKCWEREYVFDNGLLPSQITSKSVELLADPMQLNLACNGKISEWKHSPVEIVNASDAIVTLRGSSQVSTTCGDIQIKSEIRIEYDGLMLFTFVMEAPKEWSPQISIDIPYREEMAKYYIRRPLSRDDKYSGEIPTGEGEQINSRYSPHYWVGDNDKGLFWFCEYPKYWPNNKDEEAVQIIKTNNAVVEKLNIVNENNIPSDFKFEFGLQATPVKPMISDRRKWRLNPVRNANIVIPWPKPGAENSVKYFGYPEASNSAVYKKLVQDYQDKGMHVLPYSCITQISSESPIYKNNIDWIKGANLANKNSIARADGADFVAINPYSEDYVETLASKHKEFLETYNLDGYYLDGTNVFGWHDSVKGRYYPILKYRELYRQFYESVKEANPEALVIVHTSRQMNVPVLAYADAYVDGEQFRPFDGEKLQYRMSGSYLDLISLSQFRAEFLGNQWGVLPFFLPQIAPKDRKKVGPTQGLAALLLLHDVQPWPIRSNVKVWNTMYKALDMFDISNSTFIPYYSNTPPAKTEMKDVYVSLYKRQDGKALVIVANLSNQQKKGGVQLFPKAIGWPIKKVSRWPENEAKEFDSNTNEFSVDIPTLSYQLFVIDTN